FEHLEALLLRGVEMRRRHGALAAVGGLHLEQVVGDAHEPQRVPVGRLEELTFLGHAGTVPPSLHRMDTGIGYFATHDAAGPGEVARLAEEHGHNAIYFAEHTHI